MSADLPSLSGLVGSTPGPLPHDGAREALARVHILLQAYRWTCLTGLPPTPEDWAEHPEWPAPGEVEQVFGSWMTMLRTGDLQDSLVMSTIASMKENIESSASMVRARERELRDAEKALASQEKRLREETAKSQAQAKEAERRAQQAREERDRYRDELTSERLARQRAETIAERVKAAAAAAAESSVDVKAVAVPDALKEELEAERARRENTEQAFEALQGELERVQDQLVAVRRETQLLRSDDEPEAPSPAQQPEGEPSDMAAAVSMAAARCQHLRFAPSAFASAQASPFRRPGQALAALLKLDELAASFVAGAMGQRLPDVAAEMGLRWRTDVSEVTRGKYARHYQFRFRGMTLLMGPHVSLGSGSGAGKIARIYLHVEDGCDQLARGITVGHVGVHLPDTTT
jgi:hypothetical protein